MRVALIVLVVLGLLAAVSAAVLVQALTAGGKPTAVATTDSSEGQVLVAARPLPAMTLVDSGAVVLKKVAKSAVPEGAVSEPVQVVGKVLIVPMVEGEAFSEVNFARKGSGVHLAAALPEGKRAVSVSLTDHTGMVGLLYPGSVVDVMVSVEGVSLKNDADNSRREEIVTRTLLQGVQVLAVGYDSVTAERGHRAEADSTDKGVAANARSAERGDQRIVTLLVEPRQAQALQLAMQKGTLSLALRNPMDQQLVVAGATRVGDLAGPRDFRDGAPEPVAAALRDAWNALQSRWTGSATPAETPLAPAPSGAQAAPLFGAEQWETLIIRGSESEVRTFPMPGKKTAGITAGATAAAAGN